jgi:hypothetical protein
MRGNRRRQAQFAHEVWNCYNSVNENLPKTSNSVEGWHRSLNEMMSCNQGRKSVVETGGDPSLSLSSLTPISSSPLRISFPYRERKIFF